jgi:hypothetical protein
MKASFLAVGLDNGLGCATRTLGDDAGMWASPLPGSAGIFNQANGVAYSEENDAYLIVGAPFTATQNTAALYISGSFIPTSPFTGGVGFSVAFGNSSTWMVGGQSGTKTILHSTDGQNWTAPTTNANYLQITYGVIFARNLWIAVGYQGGASTSCVLTSIDNGVTWMVGSFASLTEARAIAYSVVQDRFIAVGFSGGGAFVNYAIDGLLWQSSGVSSNALFNVQATTVIYSPLVDHWYVGGASGPNIAFSVDAGLSWSTGTLNMGSAVRGFAYSEVTNQVVAVGAGTGSLVEYTDASAIFIDPSPLNPLGVGNDMYGVAANNSAARASLQSSNFCPVPTCVCIIGTKITCIARQGVSVLTNVTVPSNSVLQFNDGANFSSLSATRTTVSSLIQVLGNATLGGSIVIATSGPVDSVTTVTVLNADSLSGQFRTVSVVSSNEYCASAVPVYGASSVSVVISVTASCSSSTTYPSANLSTGAIVGIAVGCSVFATLVVVAMVLVGRLCVMRSDAKANNELRNDDMRALKHTK